MKTKWALSALFPLALAACATPQDTANLNCAAGIGTGALLGGVAGAQIGGGTGNVIATVAGTALGATLGVLRNECQNPATGERYVQGQDGRWYRVV